MRETIIHQLARQIGVIVSKRVSQTIGLWGEPGIGKTHTAQAILREVPCEHLSLHATTSLLSILKSLPRPRKLPSWAETQHERINRGEHLEANTLIDTLSTSLSALAPFVLHLEDLHEVSPDQLEHITRLAHNIKRTRGVGVLMTSRAAAPEPFQNHRLLGLETSETSALLETELEANLPAESTHWIQARTQGNPLFALEYLRYFTRQGFLWSDSQRWRWREPPDDFVPVTVEALIEQFIAETIQNPDARSALEARSIFPVGFEVESFDAVWAAVAELDQARFLAARAVLRETGILNHDQFSHPLLCEVSLRGLDTPHQRELASRALSALQADHAEQAANFIALAKPDPAQALQILDQAAQIAQARNDTSSTARWLADAVQYATGSDRIDRAFQAAKMLENFNKQSALSMASIASSGTPPNPQAVFLWSSLLAVLGRIDESQDKIKLLPQSEETKIGWLETQIYILYGSSEYHKCISLWNDNLDLKSKIGINTQYSVGFALCFTGQSHIAERLLDEMWAKNPKRVDFYYPLNLQTAVLVDQGRFQEAAEAVQALVNFSREYPGMKTRLAQALRNQAICYRHVERLDGIEEVLHESIQLYIQSGFLKDAARTQGMLARHLIDLGQFEEAETLLQEALDVVQQTQDLSSQLAILLALVWLYLDWQPPHGLPLTARYAREAIALARTVASVDLHINLLPHVTQLETLNRNPQQAMQYAQECAELAGKHPTPIRTGKALVCQGFALEANHQPEAAVKAFLEAYQVFVEAGLRKLGESFALEADRISNDLETARERHDWFASQGLFGPAKIAVRYFPAINHAPGPVVQADTPVQVHLRVLGPVGIEKDGQGMPGRARKRFEILAFLLEARIAGRSEVSTLDVLDAVFPDEAEPQAKANLKQQIYLIRSSIGQDSVLSTANGYALGRVGSDAEAFLQSGDTSLWRGAYLYSLGDGWFAGVRDALVMALRSKILAVLEENPSEAARLAPLLLEMEPYDAEVLRSCLMVLTHVGDEHSAERVFSEGRDRLRAVGQAVPDSRSAFVSQVATD